jgi:hypothetical protein
MLSVLRRPLPAKVPRRTLLTIVSVHFSFGLFASHVASLLMSWGVSRPLVSINAMVSLLVTPAIVVSVLGAWRFHGLRAQLQMASTGGLSFAMGSSFSTLIFGNFKSSWRVTVLAIACSLAVFCLIGVMIYVVRWLVFRSTPQTGTLCTHCAYDLTGTLGTHAARCPECGSADGCVDSRSY